MVDSRSRHIAGINGRNTGIIASLVPRLQVNHGNEAKTLPLGAGARIVAERVFSMLKRPFGEQQGNLLQDYNVRRIYFDVTV